MITQKTLQHKKGQLSKDEIVTELYLTPLFRHNFVNCYKNVLQLSLKKQMATVLRFELSHNTLFQSTEAPSKALRLVIHKMLCCC